ncbi:MAG: serine protease [Caldilineaceae bacterium]
MKLLISRTVSVIFLLFSFVTFFSLHTHAAALNIINGQEVPAGQQPWMVSIVQAKIEDNYLAQFCGGTVVAPEWVLTSAHCTLDENGKLFEVADLAILSGSRQLSAAHGERVQVDQIVRHWAYDNAAHSNDVALLHLSKPVTVTPIKLNRSLQNPTEISATMATVVGWGVTSEGQGADLLQSTQLPLVDQPSCQSFYNKYGLMIDSNTLCAGYKNGNSDACAGDSGGPLLVWDTKSLNWVQIGIVSWGASCAQPGAYGVYSRVASYIDWIDAVLKG